MSNDDWGQPTAVYGGSGRARPAAGAFTPPSGRPPVRPEATNGHLRPEAANGHRRTDPWGPAQEPQAPWSPGGPAPATVPRADRSVERSIAALRSRRAPERGLPWWAALILLVVVAGVGGYIDTSGGALQIQGGFNIGIVVASLLAIIVVKRSHMFPVVIAPPIVYTLAAVFSLYVHGGLSNRSAVIDAASNYLVYGFPAIAAASACVLIVGGIRLIIRK